MHRPYKKITAQLLLFSFLLESCYNPNIGIGKQALPTSDPANKQGQYAGEPHDKYPPKPPSHTLTTADKHPITFTYHSGQWQAAIKEHAAHGFWQHRQLPVVFEPGLTLEDVVNSNPTQQKQLLHLCPSEEEPGQIAYVYVGRGPMPQPQLLSSPAARQTTPPSEVGLAQQQATTQPQQARTSPQQAQEQPGRQAVRALPSPVQEIGEGPRSQDQLPTTPARARSKPLPAPSSASPSQGVANTQPTSPQRVPSRKALSWRNQHELLPSQRAAQAKRAQSAAMAKPGNQLAQPAAPSQAIVSLTPAYPPSLAHKALQGIASQNLLAQGGHPVRFMHRDGQWWASVRERIGAFYRVWVLPVACERHGDVAKALADLQDKPTQYTQRRIHVMHTKQIPYVPQFVYLGAQGLRGGGNGAAEASGSGEPQDEPAAGRQEDAQDSAPSQSLIASQDREASLMALQKRMAQGQDITSSEVVQALNDAQTPEEQQALQQVIQRCIEWFNEECVKSLPKEEEIQEYRSLAHIEATPANRELLASYFNSLCNKIKQEYQHGEEPLTEALQYSLENMVECTLQNMDSPVLEGNPEPQAQLGKKFLVQLDPGRDVFKGNPEQLIQLGNKLLDKLDSDRNAFIQANYSTHCSKLYALHQILVLIQQIAPEQLDSTQERGLYSRFQKKIQDISESSKYYPIVYHARLLEQSLQRLASPQARLQGILRHVGHGLKGAIYLGQVARALSEFNFNIEDFQKGWQHLQAAFTRQGISAESWYDWHQTMHYASLLSLEDASKYKEVFEKGLAVLIPTLKDKKIKHQEGRQALRFGVVQQLRLLARRGPTPEVRKQSIQWLEKLAKPEAWGGDQEVMEEMLDGLVCIAVHGKEAEQAQAALESLGNRPPVRRRDNLTDLRGAQRKKAAQEAIQAWLREWLKGCSTIKDRLAPLRATSPPTVKPASGRLLRVIHDALKEMANPEKVRQELKAYYQQPAFAQVKSLFEGEAPKHVDSLQCELKLIEQVKVKADREGQQSDLSTHHERLEWVKNPIALEDLFKKRKTKPDGPEKEIQKVLLVGEPGTGKTTLSKKMASLWAQGKWGKEFKAVYVLPVRALQQSQYDNGHMRKEATLATAIANNCFAIPPAEEDDYKRLRQQISEELKQPTTLVLLDGLDERYGASEALLSQAKAGRHKLLMLSRPYGIEQERTMVDIEIEHAGFNDGQMEAYVRDNLSPKLGEELLQFIKAYPAIGSIAHVPVNLQILCALWKDNGAGVRAETSNGSLPGLYRRLTEYIWERYARKWDLHHEDCEELFDTLGKIALDALEKGEVLISAKLVQEHAKQLCLKDKLKDSGLLLLKKDSSSLLLQAVGSQYQFPHLTFQEYFAGRALARQLFSSKDKVRKEAEKFFTKHQYEQQYGRMLSFLAGEVSKEEGVDGTRQLLSLLQKGPQEVVGVQHMLLQMRLLNELLCVAGDNWEEELAELEADFPVLASLAEWIREGLDRVRRRGYSGDDSKLLELLTTALQNARAVAGHASAQVLEPLLAASKDSDWNVHPAARSALVSVAKAAPAQVLAPLLAACKDSDDEVQRAVSEALGAVVQAAPELAAQVLAPLLAACEDGHRLVRLTAIEALGEVVKAAPSHASQVLKPLIAASKDKDSSVRRAASSALGQVGQAAPELAEQVLKPLIAASKDSDSNLDYDVRRAASEALGSVVQAAPSHASQVLKPLIAASKDSDADVRRAAREALGEVVKAAPSHAEQVLKLLIDAMQDSDWNVRSAASQALGQVVKAAPDKAEQVLQPLIEAMGNKNDPLRQVRRAASSALGEVVKAAPAHASQVLEPLLAAAKDEEDYVREAASRALAEVAKAAPALASQVLKPLIAAAKDKDSDYDVRSAAIRDLGEVVKAAPGQALEVLPPLLKAMRDDDWQVLSAASEALGQVVQAAPQNAEQVLPPLIEALRDKEYYVHRAASEALVSVVKAAPALASQVLEPLIAVSKDKDSDYDVRSAASEALGQLSLQQLIKSYWATKSQTLIPLIAPRLYHTPLSVQTISPSQEQRLVLYPSAGERVVWKKPHEEVQCFVKQVKSAAKQKQ